MEIVRGEAPNKLNYEIKQPKKVKPFNNRKKFKVKVQSSIGIHKPNRKKNKELRRERKTNFKTLDRGFYIVDVNKSDDTYSVRFAADSLKQYNRLRFEGLMNNVAGPFEKQMMLKQRYELNQQIFRRFVASQK